MALSSYLIVNLIFLTVSVECAKLNVPRILLPIFNDFATNFILEATEGGCYKWTTTRNDIVHITPLDEDPVSECSTKVVLSTVTKEKARNIAVVLAEDPSTKETLRCDVMVDTIQELRITTTTRELFMEEAPEDFQVNAYDDQGNEFSTLEGVEFDWNIITLGPNKQTVLRYIAYRDSPYETPKAIEQLESQQKKGYSILLEGVKSGSAKVTVSLPFPEYKHIQPCEVQLMVVANIIITPPEVYIMKGDVAVFKIFFLKNGRMEEIPLPDNQYYIETEDSEIAYSIKKTAEIEALEEGRTRVVLRDSNVDANDPLMKLPAAVLHVIEPDYMVLNILPFKNWAILVADHHDIVAELYTKDNNKLFIGENTRIEMEVSPEFAVVSRTNNGSLVSGYGLRPSVATVRASLIGVNSLTSGKILFQPIVVENEIMIYPRMTVTPSEVILPWDPLTRPKFEIPLTVKGGDGKYLWISTDNSIGMVSQTGVVRTQSNGFFEVAALMLRNHNNRASTKFIVIPPTRLEIVEFVMEAEIGSPVYLHVALFAEQERDGQIINLPFTKCQELPFHVKMSDQKFRQNRTAPLPPIGVSCGNIAMTALDIGTSKVTVSYFQDGKALEDSVTLSAYKRLTLIEPKREIVLAIGTTVNLVYVGGPRPLLGRASDFTRTVVSEDENIAQAKDMTGIYQIAREDATVVEVLCAKLGETNIKLMISNTPAVANCRAHTHAVSTKVICGKPRKIILHPELQIADPVACPMDVGSGNVVVQSSGNIDIDVSVYDDSGNKFLNVTSFQFDWILDPPKSANLQCKDSVFPRNLTIGDVPICHAHFQSLEPTIDKGIFVINVTLSGYRSSVLGSSYVKAEWPPFVSDEDQGQTVGPLTASVSLFLVENPTITPNTVTIYNHPGNKLSVPIKHGSGYFELLISEEDVAVVKYSESTRDIEITPIKSGQMIIQVIDLCLVVRPASLLVQVISVGIIRIEMVDKVEIAKCITAIVRLYDENDNLMDIPKPDMIDLRPEFEQPIANIYVAEKTDQWGRGEVHFVITGMEAGNTKLVFTVTGSDEELHSAPLKLQVFEPLKLSPKNGSIIINSKMQINSIGGPFPDVKIVFVAHSPFVEVSDRGVIIAKQLGHARVYGKAIGIHPFTGQSIVYAEDYVDILVVKLQGLKLLAPVLRFKIGSMIPFWVWGIPNISPMVLGAFDNPSIRFKWSADDKLLLDLSGIFHPIGVFKKKLDRVSAKVHALQVGKTRLFVNATVPGKTVNIHNLEFVPLSAWVDIEVIAEFTLNSPMNFPGRSLLMGPFTELQLNTNMDRSPDRKIHFSLSGDHSYSNELVADSSVRGDVLVTISSTGLIQSYGVLGQTLLIVTVTDEMGLRQHLSIAVEVKTIQFMNLIVLANWRIHSDTQLRTVPLGTEFRLRATFHDNIGNQFHAGPKKLHIRSSRYDLLKVAESDEDATVWIYTKEVGTTVIKGWAEGIQQTADYLKVHVDQSVRPELDNLTTGDVICLWTPVVNEYNVPGEWRSSDNSLLNINPALDIAFVGNKEGVVILTHSLLRSHPITIKINMASQIEFLDSPLLVLSNKELNHLVRIVLVLQTDESFGEKTNNLIQGWRCKMDVRKLVRPTGFKCFGTFSNTSLPITFEQLYNITPCWVPDTGQYACKLINLGVNGTVISMLKTDVLVWATTLDETVVSKKLPVKFLPGFYTPSLIILENTFEGEFTVVGPPEVLEQLVVTPADSNILYVDGGTLSGENQIKYKIQLIDYHWRLANIEEAMGILLTSKLTQQNFNIIVKVIGTVDKPICGVGRSPIIAILQTYKYAIMSAFTMLTIFFITFYLYSKYMQPVVNVNLHSRHTPRGGGGPPGSPGFTRVTQFPSDHICAANRSQYERERASVSPRMTATWQSSPKIRCSCCQSTECSNREPIYGEASTFYTSPELRSTRRMM